MRSEGASAALYQLLLGAPSEQVDDFRLDVSTGGGFDQQIGQLPVIRRQNPSAIDPVSVEQPASQQEARPFVPLGKALGPGNSIRQRCRGLHWLTHVANRRQRRLDPFQIVGIVEPLVCLACRAVDLDRQLQRGPVQWSRRYARSSRYSISRALSQRRSSGSSSIDRATASCDSGMTSGYPSTPRIIGTPAVLWLSFDASPRRVSTRVHHRWDIRPSTGVHPRGPISAE